MPDGTALVKRRTARGPTWVRWDVPLAVGISPSQAFRNRSKRAGFRAANVFRELNGLIFHGESLALARWLLDVAEAGREARDRVIERLGTRMRGHLAPPERASHRGLGGSPVHGDKFISMHRDGQVMIGGRR